MEEDTTVSRLSNSEPGSQKPAVAGERTGEKAFLHVYGPVPSRRLGLSLGISPIPKKTCNYSCVYCQLGRTDHLTNTRQLFFPVQTIIHEFESFLNKQVFFDVVTIVGEGEPTLYSELGALINAIKKLTDKPVAVITNGALLYDQAVCDSLMSADIVLPSLDAYDQTTFRKINRPHGSLIYNSVFRGLEEFSHRYQGQLWMEIMLLAGINDSLDQLTRFKNLLLQIKYERLYINTAVRPPAEPNIQAVSSDKIRQAVDLLGGISIDLLHSQGFHSEEPDHLTAIKGIIQRHPMNQHEILGFLHNRSCPDGEQVLEDLKKDNQVKVINYKGYDTYRLK